MRLPIALIILSLFSTLSAHARNSLGTTPAVRALGMGNAYTAIVDNIDSLFYNPAGLAKVHGLQLHFFSAGGAGKSLTDYKELTDLKDSTNLAVDLPPLYGKNYYYGVGGKTGIAVPMFGAAIYDYLNASVSINNPAYTTLDVSVLNDFGYAMGVGIPIGPFLQFGVEGRVVKRSGSEKSYGGGSLASLNMDEITGDITAWGRGYALDLGMNVLIPTPIFMLDFAAAWHDVGTTAYVQSPTNHIPSDPANLVIGLGAEINFPMVTIRPAFDYRHVTEESYQLFRKFNFGIEIDLPLIDIRAGFSEGYYTYGVGIGLGIIQVDVASYGVELGDYPGQLEDRRYMAQVSMELDLGNFNVDASHPDSGSGGGKGGSGKNGSGGSGNKSIWGGGGPRLKPRR